MQAHRAPFRGQVRCCSDVEPSPAWQSKRPGCSVWGESDAGWPCTRDKTFAEAEAICQSVGARLCTAAELVDGCTAGTGCQFDSELIWGTTPPAPPSPPPPPDETYDYDYSYGSEVEKCEEKCRDSTCEYRTTLPMQLPEILLPDLLIDNETPAAWELGAGLSARNRDSSHARAVAPALAPLGGHTGRCHARAA